MSYLKKGATECGYGDDGLLFGDRVFSVKKINGEIEIREECDGHFSETLSKEEAIESFKGVIAWIEADS